MVVPGAWLVAMDGEFGRQWWHAGNSVLGSTLSCQEYWLQDSWTATQPTNLKEQKNHLFFLQICKFCNLNIHLWWAKHDKGGKRTWLQRRRGKSDWLRPRQLWRPLLPRGGSERPGRSGLHRHSGDSRVLTQVKPFSAGWPWARSLPTDDFSVFGGQTSFPLAMCHGGELCGPAGLFGAKHEPLLADTHKKVAQVNRGAVLSSWLLFPGSRRPSPIRVLLTSDLPFPNWPGTGTPAINITIPWRSSHTLRSWTSGDGGL